MHVNKGVCGVVVEPPPSTRVQWAADTRGIESYKVRKLSIAKSIPELFIARTFHIYNLEGDKVT